ncbi:hypothetical protein BSKO_13697 [Bryopsis sp. KO-2023]|nr:hypothetical protein BSKO_13697 [Bryopsis sp. KO-2023]
MLSRREMIEKCWAKTGLLDAFLEEKGNEACRAIARSFLLSSGRWDSTPEGIEQDPHDDEDAVDGDEVPLDELFERLLNLGEVNPIESPNDDANAQTVDEREGPSSEMGPRCPGVSLYEHCSMCHAADVAETGCKLAKLTTSASVTTATMKVELKNGNAPPGSRNYELNPKEVMQYRVKK